MATSGTTDFTLDLAELVDEAAERCGATYYVYAHTKPDGCIFYVGKGKRRRAHSKANRNPHWQAVVNKHGGFAVVVLADQLSEQQALLMEAELIAYYRQFGSLTNILDSGEQAPSSNPDVAAKIAASLTGIKRSEETKAKLRNKTITPEARERMSAAAKKRGISEETKAKLAKAGLGRKHTAETRAKQSLAAKARDNTHLAKPAAREKAVANHPWAGKKRPEHAEVMRGKGLLSGEKNRFFGKGHLQAGALNHQAKKIAGLHPWYGVAMWDTQTAAAKDLGVSVTAVSRSVRNSGRTKGWRLEAVQ